MEAEVEDSSSDSDSESNSPIKTERARKRKHESEKDEDSEAEADPEHLGSGSESSESGKSSGDESDVHENSLSAKFRRGTQEEKMFYVSLIKLFLGEDISQEVDFDSDDQDEEDDGEFSQMGAALERGLQD